MDDWNNLPRGLFAAQLDECQCLISNDGNPNYISIEGAHRCIKRPNARSRELSPVLLSLLARLLASLLTQCCNLDLLPFCLPACLLPPMIK